jgi:hypothetical protein
MTKQIDEITRFDMDMNGSIEPSEDGEWVRFEDHEAALEAALGQPQVEPVAWMDKYGDVFKEATQILPSDTPLYTAAPPHREPLTSGQILEAMTDIELAQLAAKHGIYAVTPEYKGGCTYVDKKLLKAFAEDIIKQNNPKLLSQIKQ